MITVDLHKCNITWTRNTLDCDQSNYSSCIVFSRIPIEFGLPGISAIRCADPENPILEPNTKKIGRSAADVSPFEFFNLGFGETGNSVIWSADLETPTVEPNMKWIGRPLAEIWPFEFFPNVRSVVGRSSVGRSSIYSSSYTDLIYSSSLR